MSPETSLAQLVGGGADLVEIVAAGLEQPDDVGFGQGLSGGGAVEDVGQVRHPPTPGPLPQREREAAAD